jgi:hypothetical protein
MRDVRTIWETDRWFTFPKFEENANNVAVMMRRPGLVDGRRRRVIYCAIGIRSSGRTSCSR